MEEEIFPLVDIDGNRVGEAPRSKCHDGTKLLHPVIHIHIFNSDGDLYLQKRSATKDIQPNRWDSSVGGHIDINETPEEAAHREAFEELGIKQLELNYITKYVIETDVEKELTYCFYTVYDGSFSIDKNEVVDGRFWKIEDIKANLGKNIFTYNFEQDFTKFLYEGKPY